MLRVLSLLKKKKKNERKMSLTFKKSSSAAASNNNLKSFGSDFVPFSFFFSYPSFIFASLEKMEGCNKSQRKKEGRTNIQIF